MTKGITTYSDMIPGIPGNHNGPVRFDMTDGYVGITQLADRVLLSPEQVKKLRAFLAKNTNRRS